MALVLSVQLPAFAMEEIHNVMVRGTLYQVTELVAAKRDKINPLNILRGKRGAYYHDYKLMGSDGYPLRIYSYEPEFEKIKKELKGTPDNRSFQEAHPNLTTGGQAANLVFSIFSVFL